MAILNLLTAGAIGEKEGVDMNDTETQLNKVNSQINKDKQKINKDKQM